jgi:hypothetical protein
MLFPFYFQGCPAKPEWPFLYAQAPEFGVTFCLSGLRGLEVTFPPHDPSDAGSNPAEAVEFLRTEKFRERSPSEVTLSCLTRVVDLLHVKEPQVPKGNRWAKLRTLSRPRS